jgi:type II secretory pathway component GspD/PulD (secretin)
MAVVLTGLVAFGGQPPAAPAPPAPPAAPGPPAPQNLPPDELPTHLIKVLRTTNKAQTNRYVPRVYTVNNVNPYQLLRWVRRTAQIEEGGLYFFGNPTDPKDRDSVKSGKLVLILPEYMVPGVDQMMQVLDREGLTSAAGQTFYYFRPEHRHVNDPGFVAVINALRGNSGDVRADPEANAYLIYAVPSKTDDVKKYLPLFDVRPPQVMVEAAVYEVFVDNESKLGLDYVAWKNGPGRNLFAAGAFFEKEHIQEVRPDATAPVAVPPNFQKPIPSPLFNSGVDSYGLPGHGFRAKGANAAWFLDVPSAFFDFLVVKGKARLLTAAKIATRNRLPATLSSGDTITYYESRTGTSPRAGLRAANRPLDPKGADQNFPDNATVVGTQVKRELLASSIGVRLDVTPVLAEKEMQLTVAVLLVSHTGFDDKGVPVLTQRAVTTTLEARDGQEIILGGYAREVFLQRADKMPFLGSIPILGYLFGGDSNTTERRQVVIVLTPYVIPDASAMQYEATAIDAMAIKDKAQRAAPTPVPTTPVGFDQWLLDSGK